MTRNLVNGRIFGLAFDGDSSLLRPEWWAAVAQGIGGGLMPDLAARPVDARALGEPAPNVLAEFLDGRVRPWGAAPMRLPAVETGGLWVLFALDIALGAWLFAVQVGAAVCSGLVGTVVTLGGHPTLTLTLASICVGALIAAMPLTCGLTRLSVPPMALVAVAALCGVTAVAGVVAVLVAAALFLAVTLSVLFFVVDRL